MVVSRIFFTDFTATFAQGFPKTYTQIGLQAGIAVGMKEQPYTAKILSPEVQNNVPFPIKFAKIGKIEHILFHKIAFQ
jgi:hypothetical protein